MAGMTEVLRYTAFSTDPAGGNPAGVVLDARGLDDETMQAIATDVGYSETAFLTGDPQDGVRAVRYFSLKAEVPVMRPSRRRWRWRSGSGPAR
jgi:PhzF family phenazine biosynthesis protein